MKRKYWIQESLALITFICGMFLTYSEKVPLRFSIILLFAGVVVRNDIMIKRIKDLEGK